MQTPLFFAASASASSPQKGPGILPFLAVLLGVCLLVYCVTKLLRTKASASKQPLPKNAIIAGCLAILLLVLGIWSICYNPADAFIGKWERNDVEYIVFTDDGDFYLNGYDDTVSGTYEVAADRLNLHSDEGQSITYSYEFSDNILVLEDSKGNTTVLTKAN